MFGLEYLTALSVGEIKIGFGTLLERPVRWFRLTRVAWLFPQQQRTMAV